MGARPALQALAAQQRVIDAQARTIKVLEEKVAFIGRLAGVSDHLAHIQRQADINNPGQPVPDPPSEAAAQTTEEALAPETTDNPLAPGQTPGSTENLAADTTTTPLVPGVALDTPPFNKLLDVTAPVAGTETQRPLNETRIETDIHVGDPMNPEVAFPWTLSSLSPEDRQARTMASLRLAKLRIAALGVQEDEYGLAEKIASDESMTPAVILNEIDTLAKVQQIAVANRAAEGQRPAGLVPRAASVGAGGVQRTVPSMAADQSVSPLQHLAGAASVSDDTQDSDLFD